MLILRTKKLWRGREIFLLAINNTVVMTTLFYWNIKIVKFIDDYLDTTAGMNESFEVEEQ